MMQLKKLLKILMFASLGLALYGMEKESSFLQLPIEVRRDIASFLVEKATGYTYDLFKKIAIGSQVNSVVFSSNGKTILTGSDDNTVRLWYTDDCKQLKEFRHADAVCSATFSYSGKTILTGSGDGAVQLWDVETAELLKEFKGHTRAVTSVQCTLMEILFLQLQKIM